MKSKRVIYHLLIPGLLVLSAAVALRFLQPLPEAVQGLLPYFPAFAFALGLFLGWRFHRSRLVMTLLVLFLAERALVLFHSGEYGQLVFVSVALLLPLNLAWVSLTRERELVSPAGFIRLGLILMQPVAVDLAFRYRYVEAMPWLNHEFFAWPQIQGLPLPQPAMLAFVFSLVVLLVRYHRHPTVLAGAQPWVLASAATALWAGAGELSSYYFATAALVLDIAMIESSHFMAFRDELTGLGGRRALDDYLGRAGRRFTVGMIDVDFFKKVNDSYGHDVGDQVLKMVASRLAKVGGGGRAFRYGGEEFSVVFSGRGAKESLEEMERLRESVSQASFVLRGPDRPKKKPKGPTRKASAAKTLSVTVSIGVAERSDKKQSAEQVIKAADQALYRAKRGGRNQVCC